MRTDEHLDDDILDVVQRRMRAQHDYDWLNRQGRAHRRHAEMATVEKLQLDHTDIANRYEQAALSAKAAYETLRKTE